MSKAFNEVFEQIGGGEALGRASDALTELGMAVAETLKAGSVTITISMKPNGAGSVLMQAKVSSKIPSAPMLDSVFFVTSGGSLLRDDPRQEKLPLRDMTNVTTMNKGA